VTEWEPWSIVWSRRSQRDLRRLQRQVADRVIRAVERHAGTGQGDIGKLEGVGNAYRLRVGEWRVRLRYDDEAHAIEIISILPRGRAYRD
jgi:mRNA interferase RelE/StbE